MLKINGIEIDFDITRPKDVQALIDGKAGTDEQQKAMEAYKGWLNNNLKEFGKQIDDLFGDGTANRLLGANPTLNDVARVNEQIIQQVERQAEDFADKFGAVTPNREQQ